MWWWHFKDLTAAQKHERRHLLDLYGSAAQLSVALPLAALQFCFLAARVWRWSRGRDHGARVPSSPRLKRRRAGRVAGFGRRVRAGWRRRVVWAAGDEVRVLGLGATKGEVVAGAAWLAWLLVLSGLQTRRDYLHLTKRLGTVGASQLPLQYLLALKSPWSPLSHLTGLPWERLNALHQILGRITTALFYLHTALYLNFFVQASVLSKRLKDGDVILGLVGVLSFTAVGTTALAWLRRRNYRVFYTVHVSLAAVLLPVLYFHVHHIRVYVVETLCVFALHALLRFCAEKTVSATLALVPGTAGLLTVKVPCLGRGQKVLLDWQPGQHVYLCLADTKARALRTRNPFTVASLAREDGVMTLVARVQDGNTAALARAAAAANSAAVPLVVEGPYGLATHPRTLLSYTRVLFVAGGVGATFVVPLYRTLLRDLSPSPGSRRRQNVEFAWAVRDAAETSWAVPDDAAEEKGMRERMTVFVTRGAERTEAHEAAPEADVEDGEGVEMQALLPAGADGDEGAPGWRVEYGRPDVGRLIDETMQRTAEDDSVAIVVCGPKRLSDEVRSRTGKWVGKRDIWLHVEAFAL